MTEEMQKIFDEEEIVSKEIHKILSIGEHMSLEDANKLYELTKKQAGLGELLELEFNKELGTDV